VLLVDIAETSAPPSYGLKITTRRRRRPVRRADLRLCPDTPINFAGALARPSARDYLPDTTSSTYSDVVLHMVWRQPSTGVENPGCGEAVGDVRCPFCRSSDSRVVDSRETNDGDAIRRRRSCPQCGRRFTTVEEMSLAVVKRSGVTEPFSRAKVISGVRKACQGRPVQEDALALLAQRVEEAIRSGGTAEVPADEVGLAILEPLRELDLVAYLRFASVYRSFESLADFEVEIDALRACHDDASSPPGLLKPAS
jgi:transcriptional repressor NrdR